MKIPLTPPSFDVLVESTDESRLDLTYGMGPLADGQYLHWDELRHRPLPEGLTHGIWWLGLKLHRDIGRCHLLTDKHGRSTGFSLPHPVLRYLHTIDRRAGVSFAAEMSIISDENRNRYLVSSLMEEAITSSQLEGAVTTRVLAKELLRSGRTPIGYSERMIMNNYQAMEHIRGWRGRPLRPADILHLHGLLTEGTMRDYPDGAGRLRRADEPVQVVDAQHSRVLHDPPPAASLPERLDRLCQFANETEPSCPYSPDVFVHPVIRAILLHYMLAYDHPFVDGNGRTARALFYWSLARSGYELMEYVSISRLLRQAPAQYGRAFLHSETDDNDATYFILHQLDVIARAIEDLHAYLERKSSEQVRAQLRLRHVVTVNERLNHRQVAILAHAVRHPGYRYTVESHRRSHRITPQTARVDLMSLANLSLLEQGKRGRAWVFTAPADLSARIDVLVER